MKGDSQAAMPQGPLFFSQALGTQTVSVKPGPRVSLELSELWKEPWEQRAVSHTGEDGSFGS